MLKCYILANENANAASELYFNRYPERRHPDCRIQKKISYIAYYNKIEKTSVSPSNLQINIDNYISLKSTKNGEFCEVLANYGFHIKKQNFIIFLRNGNSQKKIKYATGLCTKKYLNNVFTKIKKILNKKVIAIFQNSEKIKNRPVSRVSLKIARYGF